jgi:hypothetical protein
MRTKIIIILLIIIALILLVSLNVFQSPFGPHGGMVKDAGEYQIEMKNPYGKLYAFLLDKAYTPIKNKRISCSARYYFPDNTTTDVDLKPFGEDGFVTETTIKFNLCKITFNLQGKSVSAKFENENPIVQKKQIDDTE